MSSAAPRAPAAPRFRRLVATRYVTALREGGSVPAVVEADDGALYVVKFRAAAQGGRALAAEIIVGELARAAGLPMPELAFIEVDAALGRSEPHQEIRELLIASAGENLAMGYLSGALGYDVAARRPVDGALASLIVALDVFAANVDRTARNPNLLWKDGQLWLIDHGAALYWHHGWEPGDSPEALAASAARPFTRVGEHVLLPFADQLPAAGAALGAALTDEALARAVALVPDGWLDGPGGSALRGAYLTWLPARRAALPAIIDEANRVRAARV
ncbi:MAG TPA: HipA family kinase [Polyangia bacterium]